MLLYKLPLLSPLAELNIYTLTGEQFLQGGKDEYVGVYSTVNYCKLLGKRWLGVNEFAYKV